MESDNKDDKPEIKLNSDFSKLVENLDFTSHLPAFIRRDIELSKIYTDFTLSFLITKRKGSGKIDQLLLDENELPISFNHFLEKQNATKYGYAEIIKQNDKYIKLKITQDGIAHFNIISTKYRTKSPTHIKRISLYTLNFMNQILSLVFISANNKIKTIIESGIAKLILFIIAVITFILKWPDIKNFIHQLTK
jgi:hypothetical protein